MPRVWALPLLGLVALGCANSPPAVPSAGSEASESSSRLIRPELGPEYDVLVGEFAAHDGNFELAREAFARAAEKDPDSAPLQISLARLAAQMENIALALSHAERAFALDPDHVVSRLFLARLYRLQGFSRQARQVLLRDGLPIEDRDARLLLYQIELEAGRLDEALALALDLLEGAPDFLSAYLAAATAYERLGYAREAEWILRDALDIHPDRFVIYSRLAQLRRSSGDREGEIAVYREVLLEFPHHYGTLTSLGEALIARNDFAAAIETYDRILEFHPDDLQTLRRAASLEYGFGRYQAAVDRLSSVIAQFPEQQEFRYSLGQVQRAMGDAEAARLTFAHVEASHPLYVEARMQIALLLQEAGRLDEALHEVDAIRILRPNRSLEFLAASLRVHTGDLEGGDAILQQMLEQNPDDVEVLYQLGVLCGIADQVERALFYMQEVLKRNPENAQALNYIGYVWAERGENLDEAEQMIRKAVRLNPKDGYIIDSLGWVYYMRARSLIAQQDRLQGLSLLDQALTQLDLAMELTGGDPVVSEHLGDVYLLMDQKQRALECYQDAVDLEPRTAEQPNLTEKLERLRMDIGEEVLRDGGSESR